MKIKMANLLSQFCRAVSLFPSIHCMTLNPCESNPEDRKSGRRALMALHIFTSYDWADRISWNA